MKQRSSCRRGAFAGAIAALSLVIVCNPAPVAAKTVNACYVKNNGFKKKLKEGQPLVVSAILDIEQKGPEAFVMLRNDDGSCEVMLDSNPAKTKEALKCGNGAKATITGWYTEEDTFFPAVKPLIIACE